MVCTTLTADSGYQRRLDNGEPFQHGPPLVYRLARYSRCHRVAHFHFNRATSIAQSVNSRGADDGAANARQKRTRLDRSFTRICHSGVPKRKGVFMAANDSLSSKRSVETTSGRINYTEQGSGPVALFVHGVLLNGYLWRHQQAGLSDIRRTIAVDLLAHGDTQIASDQDVSVTANATMLSEFLDALNIDKVDVVGNDSGGGISQIFAALYPERIRSLTLTNCDAHDNWPPAAFIPFVEMVKGGGLRGTLEAMLSNKTIYRSPAALGPAYEHPEKVTDETIEQYLRPFLASEQRTRDLGRFIVAFDNKHTVAIEPKLKTLQAPTLIVWGTDDVYFDVKWSHWLSETIPGTKRRIEFEGARIFFPEERMEDFNRELRNFWQY